MPMTKFIRDDISDFEVSLSGAEYVDATEQFNSYKKFKEIFEKLPKNELIKRGWIKDQNDRISLVSLFENIHSQKLRPLFRKADNHNEALCAVWLSHISSEAQIAIASGEVADFNGLDEARLSEIAQLSVDVEVISRLPNFLAELGVILVYAPALPRMKLDGVVFKAVTGHPVIGMSFRYPRLDNFWFTFLHELSHVSLHLEELDIPIFDDLDEDNEEVIEQQANRLAKNSIVKKSVWRDCPPKYDTSDQAVINFAKEVNIHPALIAGMLQKEMNAYDRYRKIVDAVDARQMVFENA